MALALFGFGAAAIGDTLGSGWLHGLKVAAVAVVAQAILAMMRSFAPDRERATVAILATGIALAFPSAWGQVGAILLGGVAGLTLLRSAAPTGHAALPHAVGRSAAAVAVALFFVMLIALPIAAAVIPSQSLRLFDHLLSSQLIVIDG